MGSSTKTWSFLAGITVCLALTMAPGVALAQEIDSPESNNTPAGVVMHTLANDDALSNAGAMDTLLASGNIDGTTDESNVIANPNSESTPGSHEIARKNEAGKTSASSGSKSSKNSSQATNKQSKSDSSTSSDQGKETKGSDQDKSSKNADRDKKSNTEEPETTVAFRIDPEGADALPWKTVKPGRAKAESLPKGSSFMEGVKLSIDSPYEGSVEYQVYVERDGWQVVEHDAWTGLSERAITAVRMSLTDELSCHYSLKYRVKMAAGEWSAWRKNGNAAGSTVSGSLVQALKVRLIERKHVREEPVPGIVGVQYRVHVSDAGRQPMATNGENAGLTGDSHFLDSLKAWASTGSFGGAIEYTARIQGSGWTDWKQAGEAVGTAGENAAITAFKMRLTGGIAEAYDVMYRVCLKGHGWEPWAINGGKAGVAGDSSFVEAMGVKIVKKNAKRNIEDGTYVITSALNSHSELKAEDESIETNRFDTTIAAGKFYLRNEKGGVTLQSASTGAFVTAGAKLALKGWTGDAAQVWIPTWNGGWQLVNKQTGRAIAFNGSAVALRKQGIGMLFTATYLTVAGTFTFTNAAQGNALSIPNWSFDNDARAVLAAKDGNGPQVFTVTHKGGGWHEITSAMTRKALDVRWASAAEGTPVIQYDANGTNAQRWKVGISRSGSYYFVNRASGKALTATNSGAVGAAVTSATYKNSSAQLWTLEKASWHFTGDAAIDQFILTTARSNGFDLRRCFDWMGTLTHVQSVDSRIQWGIMSDSVLNSYARAAMTRGVADCYTDAATFCWLARACGYGANMRAGGCPSASAGTVPHGWTEVYINGATYVCDANLRRDLPSYNWYLVTYESAPVAYTL